MNKGVIFILILLVGFITIHWYFDYLNDIKVMEHKLRLSELGLCGLCGLCTESNLGEWVDLSSVTNVYDSGTNITGMTNLPLETDNSTNMIFFNENDSNDIIELASFQASHLYISDIIEINVTNGEVKIKEGVEMDESSRAFWEFVEEYFGLNYVVKNE